MSQMVVVFGDITKVEVDVIVNAANPSLMGGGGVDGAIHRAAGTALAGECWEIVRQQGKLATGEAVITGAGNMPVKHIIHTVGPIWRGGDADEERLLANCYRNSLLLADRYHMESIAFPNISTGIYGYPPELAATVAIRAVRETLSQLVHIKTIMYVCFNQENVHLYENGLQK